MSKRFNLGDGIFTTVEISHILKIDKRSIRYWVKNYLKSKIAFYTNHDYVKDVQSNTGVLDFYSLIETFVFYQLRDKGFSSKKIISAHQSISKALSTPFPFANQKLLVSGGIIIFKHDEELLTADEHLQYSLKEIILHFAEKIDFGDNGLAKQFYPLGRDKSIVVNPDHQFGAPIISGTNITAQTLADLYSAGETKEFIANIYDLNVDVVDDAINFACAA